MLTRSSRSPEAPCCLGRCSRSRSPSQRFRSLALVPSSGRLSLAQVFRFCSNETSCKSCAHLCPWERSVQDRRRGQRGELAATRNDGDAPSTQPGGIAAQTSCSRFVSLHEGYLWRFSERTSHFVGEGLRLRVSGLSKNNPMPVAFAHRRYILSENRSSPPASPRKPAWDAATKRRARDAWYAARSRQRRRSGRPGPSRP